MPWVQAQKDVVVKGDGGNETAIASKLYRHIPGINTWLPKASAIT